MKSRNVLAMLLLAGCRTPRTEMILTVSSDLLVPAELDQVRVRVDSEHEQRRLDRTYDVGPGKTTLPFSLGLVPDKDKGIAFQVSATGFSQGEAVVLRTATVSFVEGQTLVLYLDLLRACRKVVCSTAGETCGADGQCHPDKIDPKTLPKYGSKDGGTGGDGGTMDGGAGGLQLVSGHVASMAVWPSSLGSLRVVDDGFVPGAASCAGSLCVIGGISP